MKSDLLKEAIADAKAVKETALANAKMALEEAFTPKLQSMLSHKLAEELDDEEEIEDEMEETMHNEEDDAEVSEMEDEMSEEEAEMEEELESDEEEEVADIASDEIDSHEEEMHDEEGSEEEADDDEEEPSEIILDVNDPNFEDGTGRQILIKWVNRSYSESNYEFERDLILNEVEYKEELDQYDKRKVSPHERI